MTERKTGQPDSKPRKRNQSESLDTFTTTIRLPRAQRLFVAGIARVEGTSVSELIRECLDELIEKKRIEYKDMEGAKGEWGKKIDEVIVYQRGLERALNNLDPLHPPSN